MLKVILLSPLPPPFGGIARWTEDYLKWSDGKFECKVVDNSKRVNSKNKITMLFSQLRRNISIILNFKSGIKKSKYDVAHINSSCSGAGVIRDFLCANSAYKKNIPVLLHCHCNIKDQLGTNKIVNYFFKKLVAVSSYVLVLNSSSLDFVRKFKNERVFICPNFIDESKMASSHKINDGIKSVLYVGHLYLSKGIKIIAETAKKFPEITFELVGAETGESDFLKEYSNIRLNGAKSESEVMEFIDKCDLFLFPSFSEGFSKALLEAMSRGIPAIVSDAGANRDMIEDKGGIVVPAGVPKDYADAINKMMDKNVRAVMSEWNIKKVKKCYTANIVMEEIFDKYKEM
ncbi:MAG: glycosyltransferase family 4 protein [Clostridia bacterium]|nr:glycosyltransferase family 4 protein [Clostridia bacterium]